MSSDYLEIPVTEYDEPGKSVYVHGRVSGSRLVILTGVTGNIVRYSGVWSVLHTVFDQQQVAYFPASEVQYFSVAQPKDEEVYDNV